MIGYIHRNAAIGAAAGAARKKPRGKARRGSSSRLPYTARRHLRSPPAGPVTKETAARGKGGAGEVEEEEGGGIKEAENGSIMYVREN